MIVSEKFEGQTRLNRQRSVNEVLKPVMSEIHAFTMRTMTGTDYSIKKENNKHQQHHLCRRRRIPKNTGGLLLGSRLLSNLTFHNGLIYTLHRYSFQHVHFLGWLFLGSIVPPYKLVRGQKGQVAGSSEAEASSTTSATCREKFTDKIGDHRRNILLLG